MTEIDNPFDGEASRLSSTGLSIAEARDRVALRYLKNGDTRALAHWLPSDHQFCKEVRLMLSCMLQPVRVFEGKPAEEVDKERVPYQLLAKRRDGKKGRPKDPAVLERDLLILELYDQKMAAAGMGESRTIVAQLAYEFELPESIIREAIKQRSRRRRQCGCGRRRGIT